MENYKARVGNVYDIDVLCITTQLIGFFQFDKWEVKDMEFEKSLFWSEDGEKVYSLQSQYKSADEFIANVMNNYDEGECVVENVRVESCICSEKGVPAEIIVPMSLTDIVIENYYTADVYRKEA
ncbi:hypothetical protein ACPT9H_18130 [Brevibacillus borstelensis]|uniref:hypothetical protein n=1 Tax=Brevibacillus borstelensis TaxID=45462 RepID=UPI003CE5416A